MALKTGLAEYDNVGDIFNIDDEIKKVNIVKITEKNK